MPDLIIGFTGTQRGMTASQLEELTVYLRAAYNYSRDTGLRAVFLHGDCIGADDEAARTAKWIGFYVIAHPPSNPKKRALCPANDKVCTAKPYLERNHDIVDGAQYMVATPKGTEGESGLHSGTWATIRYAQLKNKPPFIIWP